LYVMTEMQSRSPVNQRATCACLIRVTARHTSSMTLARVMEPSSLRATLMVLQETAQEWAKGCTHEERA